MRLKYLTTVLTLGAAAGVVVTSVFVARGTLAAEKKLRDRGLMDLDTRLPYQEVVRLTWKDFLPATLSAACTVALIVISHRISRKELIAATGACALASEAYTRYRKVIQEKYGKDADGDVLRIMAEEDARKDPPLANKLETFNKDEILFFDRFSKRYFRSTIEAVQAAEYQINRKFILRSYVTLNEFYDFLGIEHTENGDDIGWSYDIGAEWGYQWIDFEHSSMQMTNGETCYMLFYDFDPFYLEYYYGD